MSNETQHASVSEWESAIGKCFLSFGSIEYWIHSCLIYLSISEAPKFISNLPLSSRLELLSELLSQHKFRNIDFSAIKNDIKDVQALSKKRNLIAHNPLMFEFYEAEAGTLKVTPKIISIKNRNHRITLAELNEFSKEAESLAGRLAKSTRETMDLVRLIPKE